MLKLIRYSALVVALVLSSAMTLRAQLSGAHLHISEYNVQFGSIEVGGKSDRAVILTNDQNSTSDVFVHFGPTTNAAFSLQDGWDPFNLKPGMSAMVRIRFEPTAIGKYRDSLIFEDNGDGTTSPNPAVVYLNGEGINGGGVDTTTKINIGGGDLLIQSNKRYIDFGTLDLGKNLTKSFTITNSSSLQTVRTLDGNVGPTHVPFSVNGGNFSLKSELTRSVSVNFNPTAARQFLDSILVTSNADDPNSRSITVYLIGAARTPVDSNAKVKVTGLTEVLDFGKVKLGSTGSRSFTVSNISDSAVTLVVGITPPSLPFQIPGNTSFSLTRGTNQVVGVNFMPTKLGQFYDSAVVVSNAAAPTNRLVVYMIGTAVDPNAAVAQASSFDGKIQAYPNPFNLKTAISFSLANSASVSLKVYSLLGEEVMTVNPSAFTPGVHSFELNGSNLQNGTYFCRLQIGSETKTTQVVLSR
jgi:hypothetical protein